MPLFADLLLRGVLAATLFVGDHCMFTLNQSSSAMSASEQEPWNSPRRELDASRRPALRHAYKDGFALSPDGRVIVVALASQPRNELMIIDVSRQTALTIRHPSRQVLLTDITFHPSGGSFALVVTPLGLFGVSEMIEVDLQGQQIRRVGERFRSYRHPAFSPDGAQLAYFRDNEANAAVRPDVRRPEYREYLAWSAYEFALSGSREKAADDRLWSVVCGLNYDPRNNDLYLCAGLPRRASSGSGRYLLGQDVGEAAASLKDDRVHRVKRSSSDAAPVVFRHPDLSYVTLHDIGPDGSAIVTAQLSSGLERGRTMGVRVEPSGAYRVLGAPGLSVYQLRASSDALVIAGTGRPLGAKPQDEVLFIQRHGESAPQIIEPRLLRQSAKVLQPYGS